MIESWKTRHTFMDDVNIVTKLFLGVALFFFIIFVHHFDVMIYLATLMLIFMLLTAGTKWKVVLSFTILATFFALTSSLFMIFYGDGQHELLKFGFVNVTTESLVRGLHLSFRTMTVSYFGLSIAFTSQVIMIFYSLMQHLKVKPKIAYAFMAAFRMIPIMLESLFQLRNALKMRYQMIDNRNYSGFKRLKHLLIPLLSQNIRKAHRLSVAMEKKGFKDGPRTYYYHVPFSYKDLILIGLTVVIFILAFTFAQILPITGITDAR
ncbi:TPA: energy-coupling factor transporter transmembrane protein EcfT [Staphylococcus pseudintermedius]|uniref:energy-coupling factor transporter transmembrane component T family protein n=1 Tax=Staphylococcus pseudintermedius TaxID=283734 RepID=UPI0010361ABE|nr:energy-coupling factor transporter transmembrane component T [Staphylococcus pseudintermedius]EGQ1670663.1 energy-coupling factor transporter transmembrane protein EcfT [Staphylococcus pseudintermedius]EGQ4480076.1 energy-coupling factor transporter transmembrane protein EcfT [Staphylococcus pseudintermedius]EHA6096037.1 energy-coupling factor transporter transmembrane protein EcfT [Staphylococcus pseudintermedius]EHS7218508.1 energy-coupling factor transporter transmembrane protein EcfT [St